MAYTFISKVIVNIILFFQCERLVVLWERLLESPTLEKRKKMLYLLFYKWILHFQEF